MSLETLFKERAKLCTHPLLSKLYKIILDKRTTLCVEADPESIETTLRLVEKVGPNICMLKLHSESYLGSTGDVRKSLEKLYQYKKRYNFLILEDRKFFDGAQTIQLAYSSYVKYVDLVTVAPEFGDAIFKSIETAVIEADLTDDEPRGCLVCYEVPCSSGLPMNSEELLKVAYDNSPICVGIIAQKLNVIDPINMIKATPGVNITQSSDGKNQQWRGTDAVVADGADVVIVGRGITAQPEDQWETLAKLYKENAYEAYITSSRTKFEERLQRCTCQLLKKLYRIMIEKKSTLCVAADFKSIDTTMKLVDRIGPHICMLKLHTEFSFDTENIRDNLDRLFQLKKKYNFLLFEDRKFYEDSQKDGLEISCYLKYVDIVTVVPVFSDAIFQSFKNAIQEANLEEDEPRGCLAVCELSFKGVCQLDRSSVRDIVQRNSSICVGIASTQLSFEDATTLIRIKSAIDLKQSDESEDLPIHEPCDIVVMRGITSKPEDRWDEITRSYGF